MSDTGNPIFTIGHSNRTEAEFLELLSEHHIECVVDVRKIPGSTKYPHFNADHLREALTDVGIIAARFEGLTGRRNVSKTIPFEVNAWWQNRSFHNYADHALSQEFLGALDELRASGAARRTVIMCSEAVWWRCHRRIISDHLLGHNETVRHILGAGHATDATLSEGAQIDSDGVLTYPATTPGI